MPIDFRISNWVGGAQMHSDFSYYLVSFLSLGLGGQGHLFVTELWAHWQFLEVLPLAISLLSLLAAAWIGMPVQWKLNGKMAFFPSCLWYLTWNSHLDNENAWPKFLHYFFNLAYQDVDIRSCMDMGMSPYTFLCSSPQIIDFHNLREEQLIQDFQLKQLLESSFLCF